MEEVGEQLQGSIPELPETTMEGHLGGRTLGVFGRGVQTGKP